MLVSVENMIFNGIDLSQRFKSEKGYFIVNDVRGRGITSDDIQLLKMPGMPGAFVSEESIPERILEVDISLKGETFEDLRKKIEELSSILHSGISPIIFADEIDREYYGKLGKVEDRNEKSCLYQATLYFTCPDPYKYGAEKTADTLNGMATIINNGTVETPPIFTLNVIKPTTYIDVVTDDAYMRLGQIPSADNSTFDPVTTILNDPLSSTVGWAPTTFPVDVGVINSDG
ncbi:phage tail family protein, partial [Neobacillus sp. MM2021_6]|uniref:distal tail protein Dit n=1 Tax=Bacillaceae TaxID=186817 RepID=UPI0014081F16